MSDEHQVVKQLLTQEANDSQESTLINVVQKSIG